MTKQTLAKEYVEQLNFVYFCLIFRTNHSQNYMRKHERLHTTSTLSY